MRTANGWPEIAVSSLPTDAGARADMLVRSACSFDVRKARAVLAADPGLSRHEVACACVAGDTDAVGALIERDPELTRASTGPFGWEPLLYATFTRLLRAEPTRAAGIRAVVRHLLASGADPNASFEHEGWLQVPLYGSAGINGDAEVTRVLIEAGADPNDEGDRHVGEALYHACEFDDPAPAALLIDAGTHQRAVAYCLGRALNFPNQEMVITFCEHGARARAEHLHQAVWRRRTPRTISALLDTGAPIDEPDEHGLTSLQIAVRWGDEPNAALLAQRGADPATVSDADRQLGAWLSGEGEPGPPVAELDEMLIVAVQGGRAETVRRLLDAGARIDGDPATKDDPLGQACWRGQAEIAHDLIERGASLTFMDGGTAIGAALHGSRHCHDPEGGPTMRTIEEIDRDRYARTVRLLLDAGAPIPEQMANRPKRPRKLIAELGIELPEGR